MNNSKNKPGSMGLATEGGIEYVFEKMQQAKDYVESKTEANSVARAEGYRYLLRRIEHNLFSHSYEHDVFHPVVTRSPSRLTKMGYDCPDACYIGVGPLDEQLSYRVYGNRGSVQLIMFQVFNQGNYGGGATLSSRELQCDERGNWEIILSSEKPQGAMNWLALDESSKSLLIRHYFYDWNQELEPAVQIEVIGDVDGPVPGFDSHKMNSAGVALGDAISNQLHFFEHAYQQAKLHEFKPPVAASLGQGQPDNISTQMRYSLPEGRALIIEVARVEAEFVNIQLASRWLESLDYASRQTSLNAYQASCDDDGVYRYVICAGDPGINNWLDCAGHTEGAVFMRWTLLKEDEAPTIPRVRVVDMEELAICLPVNTTRVSPENRSRVLKNRLSGFNRRMNPAGL